MEQEIIKTLPLVAEFKRTLKERFADTNLSFLYQKIFFGFYCNEEELNDTLIYYQQVFKQEPDDWFR